jgi:hypothetical protein
VRAARALVWSVWPNLAAFRSTLSNAKPLMRKKTSVPNYLKVPKASPRTVGMLRSVQYRPLLTAAVFLVCCLGLVFVFFGDGVGSDFGSICDFARISECFRGVVVLV